MALYQPVWYPGEKGYREHLDRIFIADNHVSAIKEQTNQFKNSILQQTNQISDETKRLIASNEQIATALNDGFNRISEINERGFSRMTSAVEDLHSDMNYLLGVIVQKLDYQNSLLNDILSVLQAQIAAIVKEWYNRGCDYIKQGYYEGAIKSFKKSIELEMGEDFFPSHYQLGRLYLEGKNESTNVTDLKSATEYLLKANLFGGRIAKANRSFIPILAECKLFLSQAYYFQLSGNANSNELDILNNAIKYCKEATELNPNLSQGWYHLTKYYAFRIHLFQNYRNDEEIDKLLICYLKAVEIDRNYLRAVIPNDPFYDGALKYVKGDILKLINRLTDIKRKDAKTELIKQQNFIALLERKNVSNTSAYNQFIKLKELVLSSERDYKTNTYFGYDDCLLKLDTLNK